jgi:pimeloyl-ACP methyl ester carboxylesterase
MSKANHYDRRRFIETAVMATAGAGLVGSIPSATRPRTNGSRPSKQIDARDLDIGYVEAGPSNGPPAILLNGSADGINSNADVARLAASGYRVIVPYARTQQQTAVASDVMALMDALEIEKALVGGIDASARTAEIAAAMWPLRVKGIALGSAVHLAANQRPLPPKEELGWWYHYYFVREERA